MTESYAEITAEINRGIAKIREGAPDAMAGFSVARQRRDEGRRAVVRQQKELIALAIGVAGHCDGCIGFHAKALVRTGVAARTRSSRRWPWRSIWAGAHR